MREVKQLEEITLPLTAWAIACPPHSFSPGVKTDLAHRVWDVAGPLIPPAEAEDVLAQFFLSVAKDSDEKFLAESRGWRTELIQSAMAHELEGSLQNRI
jgi:hypothetical protein